MRCEQILSNKYSNNVDEKYVKWLRDSSTKFLNYLLQFLPPTAMVLIQVSFVYVHRVPSYLIPFKMSRIQFLGIYIKNVSTTVLNKEKGPVLSLKIPNLELIFDGCVVKNSRKLFIALALNHINVSPFQIDYHGRQQNLKSELSSQSFSRLINKSLRENRIKHVWRK